MKPRLLDLFCGAGGCSVGYERAGFEVVGVDITPQPNYPFTFRLRDAIEVLGEVIDCWGMGYDAIHASPPCQMFTGYRRAMPRRGDDEYVNHIPAIRSLLRATRLPYVIENVEGAPLENPVRLCGTGFGLEVQRHRLFESNVPMFGMPCAHGRNAADRFPGGRSTGRTGSSRGLVRATVEVGSWDIPLKVQQRAMGVDWMTVTELSQAIPPVYTEHIGGYLMAELNARAVA